MTKKLATAMLRIYKILFSPLISTFLSGGCRYYPTCSVYSEEAVKKYGLLTGMILSAKRLSRCQAFSNRSFYDPVPLKTH